MAKIFFTAWATWQKLVFVLACAIVVTVVLGCAKLGHTHYKSRKYNGVAEQDRREQAIHRQMSQRRRPRTSTEVPFGIRAIESGVEVEGVWISRNNTPEPVSSRQTSTSSMWDTAPPNGSEIDLEKQTIEAPHMQSRSSSTTRGALIDTRARGELTKPAGSKQHPPLSYARYSSKPALLRPASTVSTDPDARIADEHDSHWASSWDSRASSRSGSDSNDGEPTSVLAAQSLGHGERRRQQSTELDLMQYHRMSQAAETGQLTPRARVRWPSVSVDWASTSHTQRPFTASDFEDDFERARGRSQSPVTRPATATGSTPNNLVHPLSIDTLPAAARRSSLPAVTPFAQFCRTAPTTLQADPRQRASITTSQSATQQVGDAGAGKMTTALRAEADVSAGAAQVEDVLQETISAEPERMSFEKRKSEVIRGHGSGFEILKPGTFAEAAEKQKSAPPVSLYNSSAETRSASTDSRRKLQKKRQPSTDSERCSSGQWSRGSML